MHQSSLSSGTISGIVTTVLLLLFVGIWVRAWSSKRRSTYEAAARMPLEEDGTEDQA